MLKRLERFMEGVEHFDPTFIYRPGKLQVVPDALSRISGLREDDVPADVDFFVMYDEGEIVDEDAMFVIQSGVFVEKGVPSDAEV